MHQFIFCFFVFGFACFASLQAQAFTIIFDLADKDAALATVEQLQKQNRAIIQSVQMQAQEGKIRVFASDFYRQEIATALATYPEFAPYTQGLSDPNQKSSLYKLSANPNIRVTSDDYLESFIRYNELPEYDMLLKVLTVPMVTSALEELESDPRFYDPDKKCDPRDESSWNEFVSMSREVSQQLEHSLQTHRLGEAKIYIIGGSLESFYNYLKIMGKEATGIDPDQLAHLQISRMLFQNDFSKTKDYIKRMLSDDIAHARPIVLFDTICRGESALALKTILGEIAKEEHNELWNQVVFLGGPEISWEMLKARFAPAIHRTTTRQEHAADPQSFLEIKVPVPTFLHQGMTFVFGNNHHFIRGKYDHFEKGLYPVNQYLYPERFDRDTPPTKSELSSFRRDKLLAILLLLQINQLKKHE